MRAIFTIAIHDLRLMFTERAAFIARLLMPIAFIIVVGIANNAFQTGGPEIPTLGFSDRDASVVSGFYLQYLETHADGISVRVASPDPLAELDAGELDYVVIVPAGFERAVMNGTATGVELILAVSDPQQSLRLESLLAAANQRVEAIGRAGAITRSTLRSGDLWASETNAMVRAANILVDDRIVVSRIQIEPADSYELIGFQQSVPGMGSMFVMLGVLAGASMLIEDRRRFTLQRTMVAPVTRLAYVTGRILGRFVVGMMQYLVAIATGIVIGITLGIEFGSSPLLLLAVMASFTLCVSALSILIASVVDSERQAQGLETLLAVTLAPLGGAWWSLDIEIIPDFMRAIARVSPFFWVMDGFKAAIFDLGFGAALLPVVVLLGLGGVFALVGTARFRFE